MNNIQNLIPNSDAISSVLCGTAILEKLYQVATKKQDTKGLSQDVAEIMAYGLCAAGIIPYANKIGSLVFIDTAMNVAHFYKISTDPLKTSAFLKKEYQKEYPISVPLGTVLNLAGEHVVIPLTNKLYKHVISPVASGISKVCSAILSQVSLPVNWTWKCVAALSLAGVAYNYGLPKIQS